MSAAIDGPGILWVRSRISPESKNILDEHTFIKWYDDDHIPEVVSTSGIKSAFRYVNALKTSPYGSLTSSKPFLAFYPMSDLGFTRGEEFNNISVKSDILPGSGCVYDMAEFDVSYLGFAGLTTTSKGSAKYILTCDIKYDDLPDMAQLRSFYEAQIALVSAAKGYGRTLRFESHSSTQPHAADEPHAKPSTWLVIHEFEDTPTKSVVTALAQETVATMAENKWEGSHEVHVWQCEKVHGEAKFFEGA